MPWSYQAEAGFPAGEQAAEVLEPGKAGRRPEMGRYAGDPVLKT